MYTEKESLPRDEKALPNAECRMPNAKESDLCPSWRFCHPANKQNVAFGRWPAKRMLIYDERSHSVYENKQNADNIPDEMSDIFGNVTWILQSFPAFDGQFAGICAFDTGFGGDEQIQNFQFLRGSSKMANMPINE